jgi:hypothetical protein
MGPFGGNTPLGRWIKNTDRTTQGSYNERRYKKIGIVKDIQLSEGEETYRVIVQWTNKDTGPAKLSSPIPLRHDPLWLAQNVGPPKECIGRTVEVIFSGISSRRGIAEIVADELQDINDTAAANQIDIQGAAFAPPGAGAIV